MPFICHTHQVCLQNPAHPEHLPTCTQHTHAFRKQHTTYCPSNTQWQHLFRILSSVSVPRPLRRSSSSCIDGGFTNTYPTPASPAFFTLCAPIQPTINTLSGLTPFNCIMHLAHQCPAHKPSQSLQHSARCPASHDAQSQPTHIRTHLRSTIDVAMHMCALNEIIICNHCLHLLMR